VLGTQSDYRLRLQNFQYLGVEKMARKFTPEELLDAEIERLRQTDAVKLAQKEQRLLNRKRKYLADLRWLEKRGKALMAEGWTTDTLDLLYKKVTEDEQ
jgi:hypothetical protein